MITDETYLEAKARILSAPEPPTWPSTYRLTPARRRTTIMPVLPYGKTVRIGDYARECCTRKHVALALNASHSTTVTRERQLAALIIILALLGLFADT
jgi:hypothetical protein